MEFDIGVIKRHPYLLGGIVLIVGGYVFYRIYKKGSTSSSDLSSESQFQALQSAQQLQNSQIQGQLDLQQGQTSAQIAVIDASYKGQIDLAKQGQSVYDDYLATQLALASGSNATTVAVAEIQSNTSTTIVQTEAEVYKQQIAAQLSAYEGELGLKSEISKAATSYLTRAGAGSLGWANVLNAILKPGTTPVQGSPGGFSFGIPGVVSVGVSG